MGTTPNAKNFNALQTLYQHFRGMSEEFNAALDNLVAPSALSIRRREEAAANLVAKQQQLVEVQGRLEEEQRKQQEMVAKQNCAELNPGCEDYTPNEGEIEKPNLGEPSESNIFSLIFFSVFF